MSQRLPDRSNDFSAWYTQIVNRAGLADYGPVKGTMVIKPYGYQLWEKIRDILKKRILILDGARGTMVQSYNLTENDFRNFLLDK